MGRILAMDGATGISFFSKRRRGRSKKSVSPTISKTKAKIKTKAKNSSTSTKCLRSTPNTDKYKKKVTATKPETKHKTKLNQTKPKDGITGIKYLRNQPKNRYKGKVVSPISAKTRAAKKSILKAKTKLKPGPKPKWKKPGPKPKTRPEPVHPVNALYTVDEKVLCYEPDPTKAKILYEAKVLQVGNTVIRGKAAVEYLIHFQGWNSSWDRFVPESLILKDDETGRALQLKLAEEAEAVFATAPKKKKGRTIADLVRASLRGNNLEEPEIKTEKEASSAEDDSAEEPDDDFEVDFAISHAVRMSVDLDYFLINKYDKLSQVPALPNIVQLLEEYVRYFGFQQLSQWVDSITALALAECSNSHNVKSSAISSSLRKTEDSKQHPMEKLYNRLRVVREVADGVRILIDFLLHTLLLYDVEREQFEKSDDKSPINRRPQLRQEDLQIRVKPNPVPDLEAMPPPPKKGRGRSKSCPVLEQAEKKLVHAPLKKLANTINPLIREYKMKLLKWSLVPDSIYERVPSLPSLIYGPNYLLRLFVKLPEVFSKMSLPKRKLRIIIHYLSDMIDFVMKSGFCGPHLYMPAKNALKRVGRRRKQSIPIIRVEQAGSDEEDEMMANMNMKTERM